MGYIQKALEKGYLEHPGSACCTDNHGGSGLWAIRRLLPASVPLSGRGGSGGGGGQPEGVGGGSGPLIIWLEMAASSR